MISLFCHVLNVLKLHKKVSGLRNQLDKRAIHSSVGEKLFIFKY